MSLVNHSPTLRFPRRAPSPLFFLILSIVVLSSIVDRGTSRLIYKPSEYTRMKTIFGKICSIDAIDPFLIVERTRNDWNRVGLKGGRSERGEGSVECSGSRMKRVRVDAKIREAKRYWNAGEELTVSRQGESPCEYETQFDSCFQPSPVVGSGGGWEEEEWRTIATPEKGVLPGACD